MFRKTLPQLHRSQRPLQYAHTCSYLACWLPAGPRGPPEKRQQLLTVLPVRFMLLFRNERPLTSVLPGPEVKGRDVGALSVTGPPGPVVEGSCWYFGDPSVVTDDAGKRRPPQRLPLGFGEDAVVFPPKPETTPR